MFALAQTSRLCPRVAPRDLKARHARVSTAPNRARVVINVAAPSMPATNNRYVPAVTGHRSIGKGRRDETRPKTQRVEASVF
jgi:hypothetical protein